MRKLIGIGLLTLLALPLMGASCDPSDRQLLIDIAKAWAQDKGLLGNDGKPTFGGGIDILTRSGGGSTGDDEKDAAIDAGLVVKNIKDADDKAAAAQKAAEKKDYKTATKNLNDAIKARPKDYSYQNALGVMNLESGNNKGREPFDTAIDLAFPKNASGKEIDYTNAMYRNRIEWLNQSVARQGGGTKVRCATYTELYVAYSGLDQTAQANAAFSRTQPGNCLP